MIFLKRKYMHFLLFLLFCILLCSNNQVSAQETIYLNPNRHNILFVFGYLDSDTNISTHQFYAKTSQQIFNHILETFANELRVKYGYVIRSVVNERIGLYLFEQPELNKNFYVVNVNKICLNENTSDEQIKREHYNLCKEQLQQSDDLKQLHIDQLKNFDEYIFMGHSRLGNGLALGPYTSYFTLPINLNKDPNSKHYNLDYLSQWKNGRLKKITFISCKSNFFYSGVMKSNHFEFIGENGDISILQALNKLKLIIASSGS